jgi:hypothetical protein
MGLQKLKEAPLGIKIYQLLALHLKNAKGTNCTIGKVVRRLTE